MFPKKNLTILYSKHQYKAKNILKQVDTCYEPGVLLTISRFIKPNFKVIEGGANLGIYTLRIAALLDHKIEGKIYAFEANPVTAKYLNASIYYNKLERQVEMYNFGLYNESNVFYINHYERFAASALSNIVDIRQKQRIKFKTDKQKKYLKFKVHTIVLDDFFPQEVLSEVNLIKLDVEHAEINTLLGAKKIISRSKDLVIIIEWFQRQKDMFGLSHIDSLFDFLISEGFQIWFLETKFVKNYEYDFCKLLRER